MIIIRATKAAGEPSPDLEPLLDAYDHAATREEQERVAAQIYRLVSPQIKGLVVRAAQGRRLDADQVESLAWEALMTGLGESGVTRLRRSDSDGWETFVERCRNPNYPPGTRLWDMLTAKLRKALEGPYLKATTTDWLIRELNELLKRRDFYEQRAWAGVVIPDEARTLMRRGMERLSGSEISRVNSLLLSAAFPEVGTPPKPQRNLMGYISSAVVQHMKPLIWETGAGGPVDERAIEVYQSVRTWLEQVNRMEAEGTLPDEWRGMSKAQRIYLLQRQELSQRYGGRLEWWQQHVRELQPSNPFVVKDRSSLRAAKELLRSRTDRVPETQWAYADSPYYIPVSVVNPIGVRSIERMLASAPRNETPQSAQWVEGVAGPQATQETDQAMTLANQPRAYEMIAQRIFGGAGYDVERAVAQFLSGTPRPSQQQVEQFLQTAQPQVAETIRDVGFGNVAQEIDQKVLDAIGEPQTQQWLAMTLGQGQQQATASQSRRSTIIIVAPGMLRLLESGRNKCA